MPNLKFQKNIELPKHKIEGDSDDQICKKHKNIQKNKAQPLKKGISFKLKLVNDYSKLKLKKTKNRYD